MNAGPMLILVLLVIGVALFLTLGGGGGSQVLVINNATYNYANASYNQTINETIVINNTYYVPGSVTIPADNVTTGTFTGDYIFPGTIDLMGGGTICGDYSAANAPCGGLNFYDDAIGNDLIFSIDNYQATFYNNNTQEMLLLNRAAGTIDVYSNIVYTNDNCEIHIGTQANYSRCFNATGQIIETIGVFPV